MDFTGGISESVDLRQMRSSPGDLFDVMYAMMKKCSMLACDIQVFIVKAANFLWTESEKIDATKIS